MDAGGDMEEKELQDLVERYQQARTEYAMNEALTDLLERLGARLAGVVRRMVGDPRFRDEIVSGIHERIARGLGSFKGECPVENWCLRIAFNTAAKLGEQLTRKHGKQVAPEESARQMDQKSIEAHEEKGRAAAEETRLAAVTAVLDQLSPPCPELLRRKFFEEMIYRKIGDELGKSEAAVTKAISRCLEAARELFNKTLPTHA